MKKVLIFIVALLALCSYSANAEVIVGSYISVNAAENEEYEVITVIHRRTKKCLVKDTLFGDDIIYTEQKAVKYASSRIPNRFVDTSEGYYIYNRYYKGKRKVRGYRYKLRYLYYSDYERRYTYRIF